MSARGRVALLLAFAAAAALGFAGARLLPLAFPGPLEPLRDAVTDGVAPATVRVGLLEGTRDVIDVRPVDGDAVRAVAVLYPGGLVGPEAYVFIGVALAADGVRTLVPRMPLGLAVLDVGRAGPLFERLEHEHPEATRIVLGHSLGGAMAARFAARSPTSVDALVLMAAYPPDGDDLRSTPLAVLDLAAELDGLATLDDVRGGLARLPADTRLVVIEGAVHAFFGRYGPQAGDGRPSVSRASAEAAILAELRSFIAALPSVRR